MKKNLHLLKVFAMIFVFNIHIANAQIPDSCTFVEATSSDPNKSGVLTIEMESTKVTGTYWVVQNDIPGYIGTGYIQYVGGDATGVPGISTISYTFRITDPGQHNFKMRAFREDYHDNDVWVRFPQGGVITKIDGVVTGSKGSDWFKAMIGQEDAWYAFAKTQNLSSSGETLHDIFVDFPTAGVYTVEFSGRATGFRIDRFYLFKTNTFYGMGDPCCPTPESAKENCQPYATTNNPFIANPIPDQSVNGGSTWSYTFPANTFVNPTGGGLGYQALLVNMQPLPNWLAFNAATRTFTGNPTFANGGKYTILVKAQSGSMVAIDAFVLTVNGNNPPVMAPPLPDTVAMIDEFFEFDISPYFTDPDGNNLTFTVDSIEGGTSLPAWLSFDGTTFTGTPSLDDAGRVIVFISVTDGNGGKVSESFYIRVKSAIIQGINKTHKIAGNTYPNPVENIVNIKLDETGTGNLILTDNLGKTVYTENSIDLNKEITIDLSQGIQSGFYILKIKSDKTGSEYNGIIIKK